MKKQTIIFLLLAIVSFGCNLKPANTSNTQPKEQITAEVDLVLHVEGMTCDHCEESVQKGVKSLEGISMVEANHEDSTAHIVFDPSKTDKEQIAEAIQKRGYTVVEEK